MRTEIQLVLKRPCNIEVLFRSKWGLCSLSERVCGCLVNGSDQSIEFLRSLKYRPALSLVNAQTYVEIVDFSAHSRNFEIIYKSKSCKYSLRFVVQVCLDHAAHI